MESIYLQVTIENRVKTVQEKAFMRFLKYKTGRGPTNAKGTFMTQRLSDGLRLETLGRKVKPVARAREGRALSCTLGEVFT